jgi:hypothetical protein
MEDAISEIANADSPDAVARALALGLDPAQVLVLAARGSSYELRATSSAFGCELPVFSVALGLNTVFDSAVRSGHYFGPLPGTLVHAELRALLGNGPSPEVYVAPVLVHGRTTLVVLLSRMGQSSLEATRRADGLISATAAAIERILRARKHR